MYKIGDRVRCLCHWQPGTVDEVKTEYYVSVSWDHYAKHTQSSTWIDTCVLEPYGESIVQKHLIKRVEADGSFSHLQAGDRILCWFSLKQALDVVALFNDNRDKQDYRYEIDIDGGKDGIIVDK